MIVELFWSIFGMGYLGGKLGKERIEKVGARKRLLSMRQKVYDLATQVANLDMEYAFVSKVKRATMSSAIRNEIWERLEAYKAMKGEYVSICPYYWEKVGNVRFQFSIKKNGGLSENGDAIVEMLMNTYNLTTMHYCNVLGWGRIPRYPFSDDNPHSSFAFDVGREYRRNWSNKPVYDAVLCRYLTDDEYRELIRVYDIEYRRFLTEDEREKRVAACYC